MDVSGTKTKAQEDYLKHVSDILVDDLGLVEWRKIITFNFNCNGNVLMKERTITTQIILADDLVTFLNYHSVLAISTFDEVQYIKLNALFI